MKYVAIFALLCAAYFIYAPKVKVEPAAPARAAVAQPSPSSDFLKRPLDRTHEVLDQVRKQDKSF